MTSINQKSDMANHRTIDHVDQIYINLTRQVNLSLAQVVTTPSITKGRLRQLNQLVKAQLESFEASTFPEEQELPHNVYSDTTSCNLYTSRLHALDLADNCNLQVPPQSLGQLRRRQSALFNRSNLRSDWKRDVDNHSRQQAATGVAVLQPIETRHNVHKANGNQTTSSDSLDASSVPCSNVIIHVIYEVAPISPLKEQETRQEHNGCPPVDSGQNLNSKSDTNTRPDTKNENEPRSEGRADADAETRPYPDTRLDSDTRPDPGAGPDTEARQGTDTRSGPDIRPNPDTRPETETGPETDANSSLKTTKAGLRCKPADATRSVSATAYKSPIASKSPSNDDSHRVDEIPPRKKMKLRSETRAELAYSEASNGDASDGESDTSMIGHQRKRKKKASKKKSKNDSLVEMAEMFGHVKLSSGLDLHLADHRQSLSIILRQQHSRTLTVINRHQFLQGLSRFRQEVDSNLLGEELCRIRYRVTLAHFADDYEMAQADSVQFLQWTEHVADNSNTKIAQATKRSRSSSLVMDRIISIFFPELFQNAAVESENGECPLKDQAAAREQAAARKQAAHTIQDWLRLGKRWSQIIRLFGYGILRLVPSVFSDEYLRTMKNLELTKFLDSLKTRRSAFEESLTRANASMAQYLSWPQSSLGDAVSGVVTSSESQSLNPEHVTHSSPFVATPVAHTTPMEQTISRRPLSVDPSISSDVTQMTDGARTSNHEQSSVETSPNTPDVDMLTDNDTRNDTVGTVKRTEIITGDATSANSGPTSASHYFNDLFYSLLSPSSYSGYER